MTATDLLRASRDGDQFHYHWAARESLRLLRADTDMVAIVVEAVSPQDTEKADGEQVIDLADYYRSTELRNATKVVYRQLKHSTVHADDEWTVSGFKKTVRGFADKFRRIAVEIPGAEQKISFEFVSNRPVSQSVLRAFKILSSPQPASDTGDARYLREYAGFGDDTAAESAFFASFQITASVPGLPTLQSLVQSAVAALLPGSTGAHPVMLKEMIARRATSLEPDPVVRKDTVIVALGATEVELLPAPNLIRAPDQPILTEQIPAIADEIIRARDQPVIIHAAGGVGKSVLATQLGSKLPVGSFTVVYDCFGDGGYRRSSQPRHQHQQGLVQLSNELASHVLCDPLIPVTTAQPHHYSRAFLIRLHAAADMLKTDNPDALLTIIIDAADNATMIARDQNERSFVGDLLRETLPENVRLAMLCRSERIELLDPPPRALSIELVGFGPIESGQHLRTTFPDATDAQAAEFHRRTGGNPRVQAFVLEDARTLDSCLISLGEAKDAGRSLLDELLRRRVADFIDNDRAASSGIGLVCEALAALRPRVPIRVLAALCAVPDALIRSFVADLGRPLLIDGDTLQFRDEPTETWFRTHHRPSTQAALTAFIDRLMPLADNDAYVAASLPQLLWEAGEVNTLVELALTDKALPHGNDVEQREVAQQRVQYALKATLRAGREFEAARLSLKAGALAAGHSRTLRLVRHNTDMAGLFLDARTIEDLVATRSLVGRWPGANLNYEGALLSSAPGQTDLARSRLRSAIEWMTAWVRQPHEHSHGVEPRDIAEVAFGLLNADGTVACIDFLSRWKPNRVAFDAGLIVAYRLADAGRTAELEQLAWSASKVKYLQYAVACAGWRANYVCTARTARRLVKTLKHQRKTISFTERNSWPPENLEAQSVTWIVAMGLRHRLLKRPDAERILSLSLPATLGPVSTSFSSPEIPLLCGYALLAHIRQQPFVIADFASPDIAKALKERSNQGSRAVEEFRQELVPLADWVALWMDCWLGRDQDLDARFRQLAEKTLKQYSDYQTPRVLINGITRVAGQILSFGISEDDQSAFLAWCKRHENFISTDALIDLVRATAGTVDTENLSVEIAALVRTALDLNHLEADEKADKMVALARATYRFDPAESSEHFSHARDLTDRIGDDARVRWKALLTLAAATAVPDYDDEERAYRVAQIVEGLEPYITDAADDTEALTTIGLLSPRTAVAVASRWRDRRLCTDWAFVQVIAAERSPLSPSPEVALALLPFVSNVPTSRLLEESLRANPNNAQRVASAIGAFTSHTGLAPELIEHMSQVTDELGIDLAGTPLAAGANLAAGRRADHFVSSTDWSVPDEQVEARAVELGQARELLAGCDLATVDGWERAREILHATRQMSFTDLADHAVSGRLTKLDNVLAAFMSNPHFSAFDYAVLIERLAHTPRTRAAVRQLREMATEVPSRFCRELTLRGYDPVDLKTLRNIAEINDDLAGHALRNLGAQPTVLDAQECFTLAAFLASRLRPDQAQVALDDLNRMFLDVAPADSGDGNFESVARPPDQLSQCIAGYLWSALGDPEPAMRWRAAHSVRLLIGMDRTDELQALYSYATGTLSHLPFTDARLPFYDKHALQWLLLALARASQETANHQSLGLFAPLLHNVLFRGSPHVVMQASAKTALSHLVAAGCVTMTPQEVAFYRQINVPTEIIHTRWSDRLARDQRTAYSPSAPGNPEPEQQSEPFSFFFDFAKHWCEPLAKAFGLPTAEIEQRAAAVITESWHVGPDPEKADPRHDLGIFHRRRTHAYKSEWPEAEPFDFYLAVHALWSVAGELIATRPVRHNEDDDDDLFRQWIRRFLVTRDDGRWLADRRDPSPDSVFTDDDRAVEPDWIWRLASHNFAELLLVDEPWITVWEYSDDDTYEASQHISIQSALANSGNARALALALQTAPSWMAFRIPHARDTDYQFDEEGYELAGWIIDPDHAEGADRLDPIAADIRYPPPHPTPNILRILDLNSDPDMRIWTRNNLPLMRSRMWDDTTDTGRGGRQGRRGQRLQIDRDLLKELLQATGRSMIVEVSINRTHERLKQTHTRSRSHHDDESLPFLERSFKIYLFDESGGCREL